jgi:hypothetical protein
VGGINKGIMGQASLGKNVTPYLKNNQSKSAEGMA